MSNCSRARICALWVTLLAATFPPGCAAPRSTVRAPSAEARSLPDPKDDLRPMWTATRGEFITDYLVCGGFAYDPRDEGQPALAVDYLADRGGEAAIKPAEGMSHKSLGGAAPKWVKANTGRTLIFRSVIDPPHDARVAYAYATVDWPAAGPAVLSVGSDDDLRVWLNGRLVHEAIGDQRSDADRYLLDVQLKAGANSLLFKVANRKDKWGLQARVLDAHAMAARPMKIEPAPAPGRLSVQTDHPWYASRAMGQVKVDVLGPGGALWASADAPRGGRITFDTARWPIGACEIRCLAPAVPTPVYVPWYNGDALAAARDIDASRAADPNAPSALVQAMLAELVRDRLKGNFSNPPPEALRSTYSALLEFEETRRNVAVRPGGMARMAWIDPLDDSPQFARVYLPPQYEPSKKWPMVVCLHGYNPSNPRYVNWWSVDMRHHAGVDRFGFVLVEVHGRGNTGYSGIGEDDVLRAIERAKKLLSIDDDRVYLTGESMGGGGTWHVASRNPELFAAIAPVYGGWDYRTMVKPDEFARLTPEQRFARERWSSYRQAESLLTTPVFINHGDADELVHVDCSRYGVRMLQRWGYDVRYWEHPGKGHTNMGQYDTLYPWLLEHRRISPAKVRVRASELKSARAHWLRLTQTADPEAWMQAEAEITGPNTLRLDTRNVLECELSPKHAMIDPAKPLTVTWNAAAPVEVAFKDGHVTLGAPGYARPSLVKTSAIEGPIEHAQATPFAIVEGTISADPAMKMMCRHRAQSIRRGWEAWQKVTPRYFRDVDLTARQMREYSLILVGGADDNAVTRQLAGQLPLKVTAQSIEIDGKATAVRHAGVQIVYPHPLNRQRYVSVIAATSANGMFHTARLPHDVDFAITDGRTAPDDDREAEGHVLRGTFDFAWKYSDRLARFGDAKARQSYAVRKVPAYASAADAAGAMVMLSDVIETRSEGSFDRMERDVNWRGKPIALAGKTYARGLGVHAWRAVHSADWDLGGQWKALRAVIGVELDPKLEQARKDALRVQYVVRGDGRELYKSPPITATTAPLPIEVNVSGVRTLTLEILPQSRPNMEAISVDWADARLER